MLGSHAYFDGLNGGSNTSNFTVPRRKGSLNVEAAASHHHAQAPLPQPPIGIDDRLYAASAAGNEAAAAVAFAAAAGGPPPPHLLVGSLNGTRRLRAASSSRRPTIFGKVSRLRNKLRSLFFVKLYCQSLICVRNTKRARNSSCLHMRQPI